MFTGITDPDPHATPQADDRQAMPARDRILLSAYRLFYSQGIRATGIDLVISQAGVTKVTFYRHFPSKQDLVLAFLQYRHERWMEWFKAGLARHSALGLLAVVAVLSEWFESASYRGCAFINTAVEFGDTIPEALQISREHKHDMTRAVADATHAASETSVAPSLAAARFDEAQWDAVGLAIDGAIVRAQRDEDPQAALQALRVLLSALQAGASA